MNAINTTPREKFEWFVLRGEMKFGPFQYRDLIVMMQKGELCEYNYVWAPHLEAWTPAGELPDFTEDRMRLLIQTDEKMANAFNQRKYPRVTLQNKVYGHNNHSFFDGHTITVSEMGALVLLNNPLLVPEQKILLQFQSSGNNTVPFNAIAQIIQKKFSKQRLNVKSGLHYSVRFLQVQPHGKEQLINWSHAERVTKEE